MLLVTGYFKNNAFYPDKDVEIPDGTQAVVSVSALPLEDITETERQRRIFADFFSALSEESEELTDQFDRSLERRIKFRDIPLS
jgi:hypothetical protein